MGPEKSHSPGGLTLDSSGAVGGVDVTGQEPLILQQAELNAYLYNDSTFSVKAYSTSFSPMRIIRDMASD